MTNYSWFANSGSMSVLIGATVCPVAALKNITFTPKFEHAELYGMESTHRQAVAKYQLSVDVKCEYAMWDTSTDFILSSFLSGSYAAAPSSTATDVNTACARAKVALFNLVATVYDTTCAKHMTATIYNIYFPEIPWELRENEYIVRNLAGKGESIAICYT